jgi:RNA polymerase sigma-70 factor (ECF subfamily)
MDREHPILGADDLVANLSWVQRLAFSLARNRDAADDLTQEVARVWLERRPELSDRPRGLKAWLAAVTRRLARDRLRSEQARHAREQSVARPEGTDDTYEVVERGTWQKRVTEAVMELSEPYRSTILYCYLDQLPTASVAERMGVREATVRKRIERGLALLRLRLGGETADGRTSRALLLSLASTIKSLRSAATSLRAKITGVLLMTTQAKLAGVAIGLVIVLLLALQMLPVWSRGEGRRVSSTQGMSALSEDHRPSDAVKTGALTEEDSGSIPVGREVVAAPIAPTTGSFLVHVVWGDDKKPAPGVLLSLYRNGADSLFEMPRSASNEQGVVRFTEVQPGHVYAQVERGNPDFGDPIQIVAGKETEATVGVPIGMNCRGLVVDGKDRPIADAEVLVAPWAGGEALPLARTGPDGTFTLRAVSTHCHIGARAPGYAASPLKQFTAGKGAAVELRVVLSEPSVDLSGVVFDPSNRLVAEAVVEAGRNQNTLERSTDGTVAKPPMPARLRTDAEGRFVFHNLPSGSIPLAVRARGLSPWNLPVELRIGEPKTISVRLEPGVTLTGAVSEAAGVKAAKATINIGDWSDLSYRSVRCDANGNFRIEGLASGEFKVRAESQEGSKAETTLHAASGETVRWDPVLSSGIVLRGLVLDAENKPVKSATIEAALEHGSMDQHWFGDEGTDASGHFVLKNCVDGEPLRITVTRKSSFPELVLHHVIPGDEELVIHLPREAWVYIQGRVLDPENKVLPNVHVSPGMKGGNGSPAETADPSTGAFHYGPYPPGEYRLYLQADGYPAILLPWRKLDPDDIWDVGTLNFQKGGSVWVNVLGAEMLPDRCRFSIADSAGTEVERLDVKDGVGHAGPFVPGNYFVQVWGEGIACKLQPFEVRTGVEIRVDVQVQRGVAVEIECPSPEHAPRDDEGVQVLITGKAGSVVMRGTAWSADGPPKLSVCLLPGEYRIEASDAGLHGNGSISVVPGAGPAKVSIGLMPR